MITAELNVTRLTKAEVRLPRELFPHLPTDSGPVIIDGLDAETARELVALVNDGIRLRAAAGAL